MCKTSGRYQILNPDTYRGMHSLGFLPGALECHPDDLDHKVPLDAFFRRQVGLTGEDLDLLKNDWQSRFWSDAYNLSRETETKIPSLLIATISKTNGLAAGNTLEEAIVQASCEIFERFAKQTVIRKMPVPSVRAEDFGDRVSRLVSELRKHNIDIFIKDFTLNGLLPVLGVFALNKNYPPDDVRSQSLYLGSDFDLHRAMIRCFTEGFQGMNGVEDFGVSRKGKFVDYQKIDDAARLLYAGSSDYDLTYLATENYSSIDIEKYKQLRNTSAEIDQIKSICGYLNSELIVCDCTVPFFSFPAVRVVIPSISDVLPYFTLRYNYAHMQKASQSLHDDVRRLFDVVRRN